ncbi:RHS repeat domain-containing protein [Bacteroides sp. 214]|uniref:RHS repeat domain-containing protein n=1 Tax=Bacteroides sp. 214 TaxID=2302935 RepID=UPI0013D896A0|nr:RHS repeat-associated core domain-containing protein [Bacteroides sp. 214]
MGYNTYTYAADGRKLKVVHRWDSNRWVTPMIGEDPLDQTKTTEYVGPIVYEKINNANPVRKRVLFDGGYIDEQGLYTYFLSDHLGNVQLVLDSEERRVQFNDYYPFGLPFAESYSTIQGAQPYKYNGKELDMLHGLNWYDYGNRMMAPDLPILTTPDRFAEKYYSKSPYAYVANNPVKYVDLRGDSITLVGTNVQETIMAIYNGLEKGTNITMRFNNGVLDPTSISDQAQNTTDFFLKDLYEIAVNPTMVELSTSNTNTYNKDGKIINEPFGVPTDVNTSEFGAQYEELLRSVGEPLGKYINGNLGQTLIPGNISMSGKKSTSNNVQIIINGNGSLNHKTVGLSHEFAHVVLYLRGLPYGHTQPGVDKFVYGRATLMSKRLGYDF